MKKDSMDIIKRLNGINSTDYVSIYRDGMYYPEESTIEYIINDTTKMTARRAIWNCLYPIYRVTLNGIDRSVKLLVKATLKDIIANGIEPVLTAGVDGDCVIARWVEAGVKYASVLDLR